MEVMHPGSPLTLSVLPEFQHLAASERRGSFVLRIDPPPAPQTRPPIRLILALDVSGSMHGEKIQTALQSASAVVQSLSAADTFGCVTFNHEARTLVPPTAMTTTGKAMARERLRQVNAAGNTNLSAAMLASFQQASQDARGGRVVLLTDGCPTEGVCDPDQLVQLARGARGPSSLSAFGFGRDVNPLLLLGLSESGNGNYSFIEAGEPPVAAIAAEVGGLLMTVAAGVVVQVIPAPGVRLERAHRAQGFTFDNATGTVRFELPFLIAEEPVHLAFDLSFAEAAIGRPLGRVVVSAHLTDTGAPITVEGEIEGRFSDQRGAFVQGAARELLLARAAVSLARASQAGHRHGRELAAELTMLQGEIAGVARAAGLGGDEQILAALQMLKEAVVGLESSGEAERAARQDMVASSQAMSKKRTTFMGMAAGAKQATFMSRSQKAGFDLISQNQANPDKKP
jgi:uncharacterized protein YegL